MEQPGVKAALSWGTAAAGAVRDAGPPSCDQHRGLGVVHVLSPCPGISSKDKHCFDF